MTAITASIVTAYSQFANSLGGGQPWKFAPLALSVKRLMLEQKSLEGSAGCCNRCPCVPGNYIVCDEGRSDCSTWNSQRRAELARRTSERGSGPFEHYCGAPFACQ